MEFEERVKNHSTEMIEKLIAEVIKRDSTDIHFDYTDEDQWSFVTTHDNEDRQISLRLHPNDLYELFCGYYDEDDEFIEIAQPLKENEKKLIPEKLKKVMKKVVDDEEGLRIKGSMLAK